MLLQSYQMANLHSQLFYNEMQKLQNKHTTSIEEIVHFQTKRLGKQMGAYTAEQLGINFIKERSNNLLRLIEKGRLQLIQAKSPNKNEVNFIIVNPSEKTIANITGGTLLIPEFNRESKRQFQTLMACKNQDFVLKKGENRFSLKTYCYDRERKSPNEIPYMLSNVRSVYYQEGMNQHQIWSLTFNLQQGKMKRIQDWGAAENLLMINGDEFRQALKLGKKQIEKQKHYQVKLEEDLYSL